MVCSTAVETEAQRHAEHFSIHSSLILMAGSGRDDSFGSVFSDCPCALGQMAEAGFVFWLL